MSRRMVVNVEQGAANPSVGTLLRISDALGVGLPALVEPPAPSRVKVTRSGEGAALWTGRAGGRGVLVAGTEPPDVVELWDWTLSPGDQHISEAHTAGTKELLQVHEGKVTVGVGDQSVNLDVGDAVAFPSDVPHSYSNPGRSQRGSPWPSSSQESARHRQRSRPMTDLDSSSRSWPAPRSTPRCSRCAPTTAPCWWRSTGCVPARATRRARRCCRRPRPRPGRRCSDQRWRSCRTWRRGGRPTAPSGPSRSAPATAWRHSLRRAPTGLPRVNRLTDLYNAVSVLHQIPLGGEDLTRYTGSPRLLRATGQEPFETAADGVTVDRAPRPRRGGLVRRAGGDLPAVELAPGAPHPAHRRRPPRRCSSSTRSTR